eukprot:s2114_g9.t1
MQMLPFLVAYTLALVLSCRLASIPYPSYSLVARELWQCSVHWLDDHIFILSQWCSLDPNIRCVVDVTLSSSPFSFSWQAIAALGPQIWKHWRQQTAGITLSVSVASTILTLIRRLSPQLDVSVTVASVYDSLDAIGNAPMTDTASNDTIRRLVLDDDDLQMMQGLISISDDEQEDVAMSAFPTLQPVQVEIDLDPSQMDHAVRDELSDSKSSPPSSPEYFEFPDKDDSPPHRRDKLREVWQEQDDMVRDLLDGSMEVNQTCDAFPNHEDSPRTRTWKLRALWQEQDDMVRDLLHGSMDVNQTYDAFPNHQDSPRMRTWKLQQIWREEDEYIRSLTEVETHPSHLASSVSSHMTDNSSTVGKPASVVADGSARESHLASAEHLIAILRKKESDAGRRFCQEARLKGNVEMDATSLGKFYVRSTSATFQDQIRSLRTRLRGAGKTIPSSFEVHVMVLGACERGGKAIVWGPDCKVSACFH